ncbi:calcium/sodium antiporter [Marinobacter subterrani]|uniref:K+-dependent Na+/Ca+ exchanger like-protein n=1 Tax=Marinobacter subterrani TaxID=1658765 RepID=A0A0J7JDV9_9GAMM|nr:calcium/sodium antiporter [Marinobacter subterrani]KMQ76312.1 K+-dependent Na+/Ca+ exchanger like-protein [Marinobacter subterrani]
MLMAIGAIIAGLVLLVWSADRFVEGSATTANHFGMPPLLIGMIVVGFGTSAPEMAVSALAASQGNPGLALGNAYGSNITNIALILGITALLAPIAVHSQVMRKELPILILVTVFAGWQLWDGELSRLDAIGLIVVFMALLGWSIYQGIRQPGDTMASEMTDELNAHAMPLRKAILWLVVGLLLLIASSRILVWGAVDLATAFGISDLVIGLTIVAVGTSLPELASSVIAARKGEHDLALGNILGSNLFNTLAVVSIAGLIAPMPVAPEVLARDFPIMATLTLVLFAMCYGFRGPGRINRFEGSVLLLAFAAYTVYLLGFSGA